MLLDTRHKGSKIKGFVLTDELIQSFSMIHENHSGWSYCNFLLSFAVNDAQKLRQNLINL